MVRFTSLRLFHLLRYFHRCLHPSSFSSHPVPLLALELCVGFAVNWIQIAKIIGSYAGRCLARRPRVFPSQAGLGKVSKYGSRAGKRSAAHVLGSRRRPIIGAPRMMSSRWALRATHAPARVPAESAGCLPRVRASGKVRRIHDGD